MTLTAPDHFDIPRPTTKLVLDQLSLALLRTLTSGATMHPALRGPAGELAAARLAAIGAITTRGTLSADARRLLGPITTAPRRLSMLALGAEARRRQVWVGSESTTTATPHADGTITLSSIPTTALGADLLTWLAVRPLPEPPGRATRVCRSDELLRLAADLASQRHEAALATLRGVPSSRRRLIADVLGGSASAWSVTSTVGHARHTVVTALDVGAQGWWLHTSLASDCDGDIPLAPVGVASVYVALARLIRV